MPKLQITFLLGIILLTQLGKSQSNESWYLDFGANDQPGP